MQKRLEELFERLNDLYYTRKFSHLKTLLLEAEPADIAYFLEELEEKDKLLFFRLLPKEVASNVFVELDVDAQENLIKNFSDSELCDILNNMFLDDAVDIIEEMPSNVVKRILKSTTLENRNLINELLEYPEDSAGTIMTPEFVALKQHLTVEEAFKYIRRNGINKETIYTCYVTDAKRKLIGVVTIKDLLLANPSDLIETVMDTNLLFARTLDDRESVVNLFSKYDCLALPVIDKEGCIVGIITVDDAVDVIQEEATEDIHKMAAVTPTDKPYLKQGLLTIFLSRFPWLVLLMLSATFTSLIIGVYEEKLYLITPTLFACIPMIMGTGGNAGSQSAVTITRAIALDEVKFKDVFRVLLKEITVGIILGLGVSILCFLKLMFIDSLYNEVTPLIAFTISLALFATIVLAKIVGAALPLLAKKIKLDPAVMASPFITTIVDAVSLILYCALSLAIL
ncbi:MAG: magnesium transporter [Clostridiales bacterium]|nr:magnesium transporter [Clostridiales bacterium]